MSHGSRKLFPFTAMSPLVRWCPLQRSDVSLVHHATIEPECSVRPCLESVLVLTLIPKWWQGTGGGDAKMGCFLSGW